MFGSNYEKSVTECLEKIGINEDTTCQCGAKRDQLSFYVSCGRPYVTLLDADQEKLNKFFNKKYPFGNVCVCNIVCNNCGVIIKSFSNAAY